MKDTLPYKSLPHLDYYPNMPVHLLIGERALENADKIALQCNNETLTYRALNEQANRLARLLIDLGVQPGDKIGVAMDRSLEMVVSLLAVLKTGAAYVPLDLEYPKDRLEFILIDAATTLLLTFRKHQGQFPAPIKELLIDEVWEKLPEYPADDPGIAIGLTALAYVIYTSGSTGKPKGVMVEHHSLINLLFGAQMMPGIAASDKVLAVTSIAFDIAALDLFLPLISGAQVVIAPPETTRDGRALLEMIQSDKITFLQATPSTWKMMLNAGWKIPADIKAVSGGEALSRPLADQLIALCSSVYNMYGPTETTIYSTGTRVMPDNGPVTIGHPLLNTVVYILDESGNPLPDGAIGEIYIGGEGVARGYLHRDDLTAEKFFLHQSIRVYRTGDWGKRMEDGAIQFLGREDQQVKIRGNRIELEEVELTLGSLKGIREAVVLLREEGPDDQWLVAYVVPEDMPPVEHPDSGSHDMSVMSYEKRLSNAQIQAWKNGLKLALPPFMVPHVYVLLDRFPLTPNGKIDRKALPISIPRGRYDMEKPPRAPRTDTETMVAAVWAQALGLKEVGIDDNFFDLGGHSLIAVKVMVALEHKTGKRLPIVALFEAPTVEKLSLLLQSKEKSIYWRSLVPLQIHGTKEPLYIVHGSGLTVMIFNSFIRNLDPEQPVYGLQARGLDEEEKPLDNMEEVAAHYISEIMEHNPNGPYSLCGYSLGGLIAFEMATQLKAMGKEVKWLIMFDTYIIEANVADSQARRWWIKVRRQPAKKWFFLRSLYAEPRRVLSHQLTLLREKVSLFRTRDLKADPDTGPNKVILAAFEHAKKHYQVRPYDGIIHLFRVQTREFFVHDPVYLGWKPYAIQGVNVCEIPGDHDTFIKPPFDKDLAHKVQALINEQA